MTLWLQCVIGFSVGVLIGCSINVHKVVEIFKKSHKRK
jgi:hypothetical protein